MEDLNLYSSYHKITVIAKALAFSISYVTYLIFSM
jgi:hypothetical protein